MPLVCHASSSPLLFLLNLVFLLSCFGIKQFSSMKNWVETVKSFRQIIFFEIVKSEIITFGEHFLYTAEHPLCLYYLKMTCLPWTNIINSIILYEILRPRIGNRVRNRSRYYDRYYSKCDN